MTDNLPSLRGKRVLVTGGAGFIGSRLVEALLAQCGAEVRVLVRRVARAARIARYPVQLCKGDVVEPAEVDAAMAGCQLVFHCAYGNDGGELRQRKVNVDGTEHVLAAAKKHGARVVHVSTINVYGATPDGDLDERAPRKPSGDPYSDTKLEGEATALRLGRELGVAVTVVQPTVVYGPWGPAWTVRILNDMRQGRVMLIDGGTGLCNAVYIDDLVQGMVLAGVRDEAVGECFLLSGPQPVTWKQFFQSYEHMFGAPTTAVVSAADAKADFAARFVRRRRSVLREAVAILRHEHPVRQRVLGSIEGQALRSAAKMVLPKSVRQSLRRRWQNRGSTAVAAPSAPATNNERPLVPMPPPAVDFQAQKTAVRIDKARRLLGYQPAFDLQAGMQRTEQWARWAGLLN